MEKEKELHIEEPKTSKFEVIFNFALQVFSVFYYIVIISLAVLLFIYSNLIIAIAFTLIMINVVILQFRQAKVRKNQKIILNNQGELTFAVNMVTGGRGIRRQVKKMDKRQN